MAQGSFDPTLEDWGGFFIDPYGFGKQTPLMHNLAEYAKYDEQFPDHPLSKLRSYLSRVIGSLTFDPSLEFFGT
ncbi:MAG: hypothetical protein SGJ27_10590 [Candidatus Melainabacteria bacterium]|nr:hypothetical protein [Candidatus Melainabacteria bacterium]